jgi:hypothetical protein
VPPGQGLINTTPGQTTVTPGESVVGYTPKTAEATKPVATGYDPTAFSVTPSQTVQDQIKNIVAADSPLMQQAAARARAQMNERGLLNSSLAVGAGQTAVYDAALPIAQLDAAAYERAATNTANAQNAAKGFLATAENQAEQTGAQLKTDVSKSNATAFNTALGQAADTAMRVNLAKIDNATKMALAQLDADNRQLLQTNVTAGNILQEVVKNIAGIAADPNLSQQAKDDATASQLSFLNEGLKMAAAIASTEQSAVQSLRLDQYFLETGTAPAPRQLTPQQQDILYGGHWITPPPVPDSYDENGNFIPGYQPAQVWVRA